MRWIFIKHQIKVAEEVYYSLYAYMRELWVNFIGNLEYSTQKFLDKTKKYFKNESIRATIKQEKLLKLFWKLLKN